ncbi:ATP-binding cassette domain-containing protein [Shimia sp. R11_0]|uniref:ATP-binding cassette domain-containing protein n=1 Tax=Shimia sp. R11_0 TaxID=2821096 RepID=UPI001AD95FB0|nr:ATP-binding cassette domain-containing protein [Shimia sp. R11_0]MBO9476356.1 ATP-binding cassette domain-containing protein [Shimia sp. R11_0]
MVGSILPLKVENAVVRRRGKVLLGPVSTQVATEGLSIVMGPNGAGKTTLLRMLHGMERLARGGRLTWQVPEPQARAAQAFVFQAPIMMRRSALDNVVYPLIVHGVARAQARARAAEWLARVGLSDSADKRATVLSGGERQKMALARALIRDPQILFLDEPCANLDGQATREFEEILRGAHAGGTRIVMSTHDVGQARRLAEDIWFIHHGHILETTPADQFFENPTSKEARAFLKGDIVE